jgi:hypothetical protein
VIPADQPRRPLRDQVAVNEGAGYSPLRARLAVLDTLRVRAVQELEAIWRQHPEGAYRRAKEGESTGYWREHWGLLAHHLDAAQDAKAIELIDAAIARVEPWPR